MRDVEIAVLVVLLVALVGFLITYINEMRR
jgi:hypothetical protein